MIIESEDEPAIYAPHQETRMPDDERAYKIALAGALPAEQANGWDDDALAEDLYDDRTRVRYARIAYTVLHYREVTASGKRIITVAINRVEPVPDVLAAVEEQALLSMFERRTGQATLFPPSVDDATDCEPATDSAFEGGPNEPMPQRTNDPTAGPWPGDPEWKAPPNE